MTTTDSICDDGPIATRTRKALEAVTLLKYHWDELEADIADEDMLEEAILREASVEIVTVLCEHWPEDVGEKHFTAAIITHRPDVFAVLLRFGEPWQAVAQALCVRDDSDTLPLVSICIGCPDVQNDIVEMAIRYGDCALVFALQDESLLPFTELHRYAHLATQRGEHDLALWLETLAQ